MQEDFAIQRAYVASEKIAAELRIPFQGTNVFSMVLGQSVKFFPTLAFQVETTRIDELMQKLAAELKVDKNILRALIFRLQPVESGRPRPEGMIT